MTYQLISADAVSGLRQLPERSVQCIVTSPPYFGLRDYGNAGQIGLEPSPTEYINRLVAVFQAARRVLADDGTLWVNLGDSYIGGKGKSGSAGPEKQEARHADGRSINRAYQTLGGGGIMRPADDRAMLRADGIKPKDLMGIPWRVAFALQADGWYLRQDIIWHKPNPMPESVRDRCTKSHEYLFLLTKRPHYYYNAAAIAEPSVDAESYTGKRARTGGKRLGIELVKQGLTERAAEYVGKTYPTRNKRSVWRVTTSRFKGAHFATFPPALITPCVLAGSRDGDIVLDPFSGSGTTGVVALSHGRRYIGIDINPSYNALADGRFKNVHSTVQ